MTPADPTPNPPTGSSTSPSSPATAAPADAKVEAARKKTLWETTITSTPVILTVIATLLAGMSASEMTLTQYHRATAAQHQSKVGDQYAYFQAKRIRGTSMELTSALLRATPEPAEPSHFDAAALKQSADQLADTATQTERDVQRLALDVRASTATADAGEAKGNPAQVRLQKAVEASLGKVKAVQAEAGKLRKATEEALSKNKAAMDKAFGYLKAGLPKTEDKELKDSEDIKKYVKTIEELIEKVGDERPEKETEKLIKSVPVEILMSAYELAKENGKRFEKATDELKKELATITKLVQQQTALSRQLHRAVAEINRALPDGAADDAKSFKDLRARANALTQADRSLQETVEQVSRDHKVASIDFDARRYKAESGYNLKAAQIYELQVRKSNFESDRHLHRKTLLFYAMLAAQAGVTVATLALALRKKSLVWGLATLAGAAAISFAGYVAVSL